MEQTIYGDILFAVNFSMDFLAMFVTGKILHIKARTRRLVLSACAGGVYSVAVLLAGLGTIPGLLLSAAVAAVMCLVAFSPKSASALLKETAVFYAANFLMGGIMTGLYSVLNVAFGKRVSVNGSAGIVYGDMGAGKFIRLALAAGIVSLIIGKILSSASGKREVAVTLVCGGKRKTLNCLADSGDLLCEPAGGLPVIITAYSAVKELLPQPLLPLFEKNELSKIKDLPHGLAGRVRMIPVETLTPGSGILPGYIPDEIIISGEKKKACLGIDARGGDYGGCPGIVPTVLL